MIEVENINHSVNQCHMMKRVKKNPAHFVSLYALSLDHMDDIILSRDRMLILSPLHFNTEIARSQYTLDFLYLIILYSA